jgi:hypothetical protein
VPEAGAPIRAFTATVAGREGAETDGFADVIGGDPVRIFEIRDRARSAIGSTPLTGRTCLSFLLPWSQPLAADLYREPRLPVTCPSLWIASLALRGPLLKQ